LLVSNCVVSNANAGTRAHLSRASRLQSQFSATRRERPLALGAPMQTSTVRNYQNNNRNMIVRFRSKADIWSANRHVCFTPTSTRGRPNSRRPLANSARDQLGLDVCLLSKPNKSGRRVCKLHRTSRERSNARSLLELERLLGDLKWRGELAQIQD